MLQFFNGRQLRYQLHALLDQRWQLIVVIDDERDQLNRMFDWQDFEALEARVLGEARKALAIPGTEAVRVVRERMREDGFSLEEPIYTLTAANSKAAPRVVAPLSGATPLCAGVEDLLHRPALRVIGRILRPMLDYLGATPIELVTLKATASHVQRAETGIAQAIGRIARLQAPNETSGLRERVDAIETIARDAKRRVRDAEAVRKPPILGDAGLDGLLAEIDRVMPAPDRRFWALRALSAWLDGSPDYISKLDQMLTLAGPTLSETASDLLDEMLAAILDHVEIMRDLLGRQPDLGTALLTAASLAGGRVPPGVKPDRRLAGLVWLIDAGRLPKAQDAIWDRIDRTLAGRSPLSAGAADAEFAELHRLREDLLRHVPEARRADFDRHITRRSTSARQQFLEDL